MVHATELFGFRVHWQVVDLSAATLLAPGADGSAELDASFVSERFWSACAADLDGDGLDELALLGPKGGLELAVPSGVPNGLDGDREVAAGFVPDGAVLLAVQHDEDERAELCVLAVEIGSSDHLTLSWADAQGESAGLEPGVQPFHVVTYWTRPIGSGY